jgi:ABC-2 type transport system ATP-binding protein
MILETNHINKNFHGKNILTEINLAIPKGTIYGLIGPNGAGKTTLIRILTKIIKQDAGEILFDGHQIKIEDVFKMGYLPEERGLYKKMGVEEQLLFFAALKNTPLKKAKSNIKAWAQKFDLEGVLYKNAEELSKGMQQKVQLLAALIHEPQLLILDEPFSGFDPIHAQLLLDEILALKAKGTSIILSSHRMENVEQLCDNLALINQGKLVLSGELNQIQKKYSKNEWLIEFEGHSPQNSNYFEVQEIENLKTNSVLIKPQGNINLNLVLGELMNQGVQLKNIKEQKASMASIFIEAVAENKQILNQHV